MNRDADAGGRSDMDEAVVGRRVEVVDGPRGGSAPLVAWACLQLALGTLLVIWSSGSVSSLLFLNGAVLMLSLAAFNRLHPPGGEPRLLARVSVPVVLLAIGTVTGAIGFTAGLWLGLIGGEIVILAFAWLVREIVVEHRTVGDG